MSVFESHISNLPPAKPVHKAAVGAFGWAGCYTETLTGPRALSAAFLADDAMTVEMCAKFCGAYTYAGLEYGREVYQQGL